MEATPINRDPYGAGTTGRAAPSRRASPRLRAVPFNTLSLIRRGFAPLLSAILLAVKVAHQDSTARQLAQLYFARWLVLSSSRVNSAEGAKRNPSYLLFISDFTGGWDEYLTAFACQLTSAMNLIWGRCVRWPGALPPAPFKDYVSAHQLYEQAYFNAYGRATILDIQAAQRVSDLVETFVLTTGEWIQGEGGPDVDEKFQSAFNELLLQLEGDLAS